MWKVILDCKVLIGNSFHQFLRYFFNPNYSQIIMTLLKNLAFCFITFRKKPVFLMRGYLDPSRKPSRIHKLHSIRL